MGKVREFLSDPARWSKGAWGRDASGTEARDARLACSFCLVGAICQTYDSPTEIDAALKKLREIIARRYRGEGAPSVVLFNDHPDTTHADILSVLDEAGL